MNRLFICLFKIIMFFLVGFSSIFSPMKFLLSKSLFLKLTLNIKKPQGVAKT